MWLGPQNLTCEKYELDDPCNTVDLDAGLFRQVAPGVADLDYLAHVRSVNTGHKETASFLTDGNFSRHNWEPFSASEIERRRGPG